MWISAGMDTKNPHKTSMNPTPAQRVYLDYNATAPLRPTVRECLFSSVKSYGNPSSLHAEGRAARALVETAREQVAGLVGASPAAVTFNSGATEGNATVVSAFARQGPVLACGFEHPSVRESAPGYRPVPATPAGLIDLEALDALCSDDPAPALVCVMLANNETGAVQPVAQAAAIARRHGIPLHCDAVQAVGRIPVDIKALGVDFLTLSAHKIGGPPGAGALVVGACRTPPVLLSGGGQERGARAGTENVPALAAFGEAARAAREGLKDYAALTRPLRDRLERQLTSIDSRTVFFARGVPRVPNTSLFALPGLLARTALIHCDLAGVAISNGSACSSGVVKASPVLSAMGVPADVAECALRVSLGWDSTDEDIDRFLQVWAELVERTAANRRKG